MQLILDMGSGNTCKNNKQIIRLMIDKALPYIKKMQHEVVLKWQLFKDAPPNVPLSINCFDYAYKYASDHGVVTTSSVFDSESIDKLLQYDVPFVKIACRDSLLPLAKSIAKTHRVYMSINFLREPLKNITDLACIPMYPAKIEDYEKVFMNNNLQNISDHTVGFELYNKYKPKIFEKHYVLDRSNDNPDSGQFAILPEDLINLC